MELGLTAGCAHPECEREERDLPCLPFDDVRERRTATVTDRTFHVEVDRLGRACRRL